MSTENSTQSGFEERAYRNALGCFGTGVCLVSTRDEKGRVRAITVNSFSSVSLYPPMILWCIDKASARFDLFSGAEHFSVNVLREDQADLSVRYAKDVTAELSGEDVGIGAEGIPFFTRALAHLECRTAFRQLAGDHLVIFGHVLHYQSGQGNGLGYFRGGYTPIRTAGS